MKYLSSAVLIGLAVFISSCAGIQQGQQQPQCPEGTLNLPDCPPLNAVVDEKINDIYAMRTWLPEAEQSIDPIRFSVQANIPVQPARAKVMGPKHIDALNSLAAKIWMIENAQHTVDAMYYIFKRDPVGYAMLGAMCNAVKRGVDVRIMVDSLGSIHPTHPELKALETCADEAGFMRNGEGEITTRKARVQAVIFNAISKMNINRRSHDKLLVVDGRFPDKAAVMTGGRNVSLDYYGIREDGSEDPTAFRDLEILLRPALHEEEGDLTVGKISEGYYSILFLYRGNKRIRPAVYTEKDSQDGLESPYPAEREKAQQSLAFLKNLPALRERLVDMPRYMNEDFHDSKVRLAHQLNNLTATDVVTKTIENIEKNPNSIMYIIDKIYAQAIKQGERRGTLRIVSPYLFLGKYYDEDGNTVYDGAQEIHKLLRENPGMKIEVVTNSGMTSDNFFTQAIIDMDMAPRMLLTPELQKAWLSGLDEGEFNPEVVESEEWKKLVDHPQIFIYQTGRLDSVMLGNGTEHYGKLHAKYIIAEETGFIGTSNFDYRSNLYNNEMGFFIEGNGLRRDLIEIFELLKKTSYRWGTPEWLQMRKELMASDSKKARPMRRQRKIYKRVTGLGLEYLM
jgi:putative cardiolipin synthase